MKLKKLRHLFTYANIEFRYVSFDHDDPYSSIGGYQAETYYEDGYILFATLIDHSEDYIIRTNANQKEE